MINTSEINTFASFKFKDRFVSLKQNQNADKTAVGT